MVVKIGSFQRKEMVLLTRLLTGGLVVLLMVHVASAVTPQPDDLVRARLLADRSAIVPGEPFQIGLHLKIQPQWHVYWINAGDGGLATTVELHLPEGFKASAVRYPVPRAFVSTGQIVNYGYEDEVLLIATITPPKQLAPSPVTIAAEATWLVCKELCLPGQAKLQLTLPVGGGQEPPGQDSQLFAQWSGRMPVEASASPLVSQVEQLPSSPGWIEYRIDWKGHPPGGLEWFPPPSPSVSFSRIELQTNGSTTLLRAGYDVLAGHKPPATLHGSVLGFQTEAGQRGGIELSINIATPRQY